MISRGVQCFVALIVASFLLLGCNNQDSVPSYTADEQKLVDQLKNESPEQQIERIQKGPMPEAAKAEMIKRIKDEHGIK